MVNSEWTKADFCSRRRGRAKVFTIYYLPFTIYYKEI
jgi:hypothetical protein